MDVFTAILKKNPGDLADALAVCSEVVDGLKLMQAKGWRVILMALLINGGGGRKVLNLEIAVDKRDKPGIQAKLLTLQNLNEPTC